MSISHSVVCIIQLYKLSSGPGCSNAIIDHWRVNLAERYRDKQSDCSNELQLQRNRTDITKKLQNASSMKKDYMTLSMSSRLFIQYLMHYIIM